GSPVGSPVAGSTFTREANQLYRRVPIHTWVRPSPHQATSVTHAPRDVRRSPLPSGRTVYTSPPPATKAMSAPSGDQAGLPCPPGPVCSMEVTGRGGPPAAGTSHS